MNGRQKTTVGILAGLIAGIFCMWLFYAGVAQSMIVDKNQYDRFTKADTLIDYIDENYYMDADNNSMSDSMLKGIVEGLNDPYSAYMTAEEYEAYSQDMTGEYCGVGIVMTLNDKKQIEVVSVMSDSPAEKAGIKKGDIIKSIDGKEYSDFFEAAESMKGEKGTEVKVKYAREGKSKETVLVRDKIKTETVTSKMMKDDIGYIQISQFISGTGDEFVSALKKMEKEKAKGLVIDLRHNGGGRVDECIKVADELLDEGVIVCYVDNKGNKTYSRSEKGKTDIEYVLLVDEATASASEIVTAAVKDNKGGKIVGQNTYGKGVIQKVNKLEDGSAIKLTVMQYLSPDGNAIHKKGIKPDYVVKNTEEDKQLEKAVNLLTD